MSAFAQGPQGDTGPSGSSGRSVEIRVFAIDETVTTGDGRNSYFIPPVLNALNLVTAEAAVSTVSSSGAVTVQIRNVTQAVDMLTTKITIDASEFTSFTAAAPSVIDTGNDDVVEGDELAIDVDGAGTGAEGLVVILEFA